MIQKQFAGEVQTVVRMLSSNRPHFFKVFLPQISSEQLKIPPGFIKHMEGRTSGSVILTGPSGNSWKVVLIHNENGLFFRKGWPEFARDHLAETGDFFVFRYDGDLHFYVQTFDCSACEKEAAFNVRCSEDNSNIDHTKGKKRIRGKSPLVQIDSITKKIKVEEESSEKRGHGRADQITKNLLKAQEQRVAESYKTEHPFFVRSMRKYNIHRSLLLNIPAWFTIQHLSSYRSKTKVAILNLEGHHWAVNFINKRGNQSCLSVGWASFVHDNHIKEGDICIFELVGELQMHVQLIRRGRQPHAVAS